PANDIVDDREFVRSVEVAARKLAADFPRRSFILGSLRAHSGKGRKVQNIALFISNGIIQKTYAKRLLPTYDVFDEDRYFEPGQESCIVEFQKKKIFLSICEDFWFDSSDVRCRNRYAKNPLDE